MAFEPLGYGFEIRSRASPAAVKAAIRSAATSWFDEKTGARGWILGPFMCLWFSAFDRYGPMVLARISHDGAGARISGRAGSDLNGMILLVLLAPFVIPYMVGLIASAAVSGVRALFLGGLVLMIPLGLWWAHADRREAEPLVRFLTKVTADLGRGQPGARRQDAAVVKALTLTLSGDATNELVTVAAIEAALMKVGAGDFLILGAEPEVYIQSGSHNGVDFVLERRDGAEDRHFKAWRADRGRKSAANELFSYEEALEILIAYATDAAMPGSVLWRPLSIGASAGPKWRAAKP